MSTIKDYDTMKLYVDFTYITIMAEQMKLNTESLIIREYWENIIKKHIEYADFLKITLNQVPHSIEQRCKNREFGKVQSIKLLKNEMNINLQEAIWFYDYIVNNIHPWFFKYSNV